MRNRFDKLLIQNLGIAGMLALAPTLGCQSDAEAPAFEPDGETSGGPAFNHEAETTSRRTARAPLQAEPVPDAPALDPFRSPPALRAAAGFAVFGAGGVRNVGETTLVGELGVGEADAIEGLPDGMAVHAGSDRALEAERAAVDAYDQLADEPCSVVWQGSDLRAVVFTPGVHCFASSVTLSGGIVFDALGHDDAVFILKVAGNLETAEGSRVSVRNCAHEGRVFWQLDGDASLGAASQFAGNLLTAGDVALAEGASSHCRVLAQGNVSLDTNHVSIARCGETRLDESGALEGFEAAKTSAAL